MRMLIRFGKRDRLRFISHLDLQRFFQRALNRTGLPIAFSQGFNPHPVMSFGSALAMGWTSEYEIVDVKLAVPMGRKRAEDAMRAALPEDLPVLQVKLIDDKHPAPMAQVKLADYRIQLPEDAREAIIAALPGFLAEETVMALRKTKSGEKPVNIRPLAIDVHAEGEALFARLMLTERDTLKPDLLINTLAGRAGIAPPEEVRIHRLCLWGEDNEGNLKELMDL